MIEAGLQKLIQADPAVKAIAKTGGFLAQVPKDLTLPTWTMMVVSQTADYTLQGEQGPFFRRIQIDCYGKTAAEAMLLAKAIDDVINNFTGALSDEDSTVVQSCLQSDLQDFPFDDASRTFRRMIEYQVCFIPS